MPVVHSRNLGYPLYPLPLFTDLGVCDRMILLEVSYAGFDPSKDRLIEKAVGRRAVESGFGFGQRDLVWYYKGWQTAGNAERRVKKLHRRLRIRLIEEE